MTCKICNGQGWTEEYSPYLVDHDEDGSCNGYCPVQVQCENCHGTGEISPFPKSFTDSGAQYTLLVDGLSVRLMESGKIAKAWTMTHEHEQTRCLEVCETVAEVDRAMKNALVCGIL